jgi:predicted DNA-binding transcriptional regulator AlpA
VENSINPSDEYLDEKQLEDLLHVSRFTVWRYRKGPGFPKPIRVGGRLLFPAAEIRDFLRAQRG